ncbi:hypothetical protein C5167_018203 [Papaver somniferum]|uniref:Uncharacterized protein n=1 Tax=Papaver somniferum TaxID=3469 RepID=A0A4Y7IPQ0_PAPSO|nr:hypothetical protein C5167_018203 [Papaver somniferum]
MMINRVEFEAGVKNSIVKSMIELEAVMKNSFADLKVVLEAYGAELKGLVDCLKPDEDSLETSSRSTPKIDANSEEILHESKLASDFTQQSSTPPAIGEVNYRSTQKINFSNVDEEDAAGSVLDFKAKSRFLDNGDRSKLLVRNQGSVPNGVSWLRKLR